MRMITVEDFIPMCGCRSVQECSHGDWAWLRALERCVEVFSEDMLYKLKNKFLQGYDGWDDPNTLDFLKESLKSHMDKGDMVDVANLAMFIWNIENGAKE